jgi:hypothetical protein
MRAELRAARFFIPEQETSGNGSLQKFRWWKFVADREARYP